MGQASKHPAWAKHRKAALQAVRAQAKGESKSSATALIRARVAALRRRP